MTEHHCSLEALRFALNHLYEPQVLRTSPLVGALAAAGRANVPSALQRTLTDAIEALKPSADLPAHSRAWRTYEVLFYRYVQQCSQQEVADQLGVSTRHLKREQRSALEALAHVLRERFGLAIDVRGEAEPDEPHDSESAPSVDSELRWLRELPPGTRADLGEVLPAVLELLRPMIAQHAVRPQVDGIDQVPSVAAHPIALREVLLSLLTVAVRQAEGGELAISASSAAGHVEVRILGEDPRRRHPLGPAEVASLAMAGRLASLCGGSVISSADAGAFTAALALPGLEQVSVLVVDDNADTLRLLERHATGTTYRIVGVQNPARIFDVAGEVVPRAIVLDVMMPEMDGWELLGRLRQHPDTSRVPVLVCTILAQEELAFSLGANAFLRKPFSRLDLLGALDRLTGPAGPGLR